MSNTKFKSILIVDKEKGHANKILFGSGLNIVTSTENSVGKSSLSLMLLYAFGAKVYFSDKWNLDNIFTKLEIIKDQDTIIIERFRDSFLVRYKDETFRYSYLTHGFADKLYDLLGFSIKIKNKNDDRYSTAVPSIYLLPYYIPQTYQVDERSVFSDLAMYKKNDILDSMYFHVGVLDNEYVNALIEVTKFRKEKQKAQEQIKIIQDRIAFLNETIKRTDSNAIVDSDNTDVTNDVKVFEKYSIKKQEYYDLLKHNANLQHQLKLLENSKKSNLLLSEKIISSEEIRCPNCNQDITDFLKKALDIGYANDRITKELLDVKSQVVETQRRIDDCKRKLDILCSEVEEINKNRQHKKTTEDVVLWNKELLTQKNAFYDCNSRLEEINENLEIQEKIVKSYAGAKGFVDKEYRVEYKRLLEKLNVNLEALDLSTVRLYQSVKLSGSEIPRLAISKYIAYLKCKNDASVGLPIMVDFPNLDLTDSNINDCFQAIFDFISDEKKESQSFIFSINCLERLGRINANITDANIINFDGFSKNNEGKVLLLSKEKYEEHLEEIQTLFTN